LSVPKNRSAEFDELLRKRQQQGEARSDRLEAPDLLDAQDKQKSGPV
jgi:hypothetical protein